MKFPLSQGVNEQVEEKRVASLLQHRFERSKEPSREKKEAVSCETLRPHLCVATIGDPET